MKMSVQKLARKLASTYPNSIAENDGVVDYETTVGNIADRIMEEIPENYMQGLFSVAFQTTEQCEDFLKNKLPDLYDECQKVIDERNNERC